MPPASLSVRFQNVLPSEDLLRFAQRLWGGLDVGTSARVRRATLSIERTRESFHVRLAFGGSSRARAEASGADPFLAVRHALEKLEAHEIGGDHVTA